MQRWQIGLAIFVGLPMLLVMLTPGFDMGRMVMAGLQGAITGGLLGAFAYLVIRPIQQHRQRLIDEAGDVPDGVDPLRKETPLPQWALDILAEKEAERAAAEAAKK